VRLPVAGPAAVGVNTTCAVQLAAGASVAAQVLFLIAKPAGTARLKPERELTAPLLVTVTVAGLLDCPTPVVANWRIAGVTWMALATAPVPERFTIAELAIAAEVTLSDPLAAPVAIGVNTTPTVQLAPAASVAVQVFCVSVKPSVGTRVSAVAAELLVLLTVTVCAVLGDPTMTDPKLSWAGLTLSPAAICAAPFRGTVTGVTPGVAEEITSEAWLPPATKGLKITCTVQLVPAASVAVQVVVPVEKLAAAGPVIWKPTLAAATPPVLVMVSTIGVLAAPKLCVGNVMLAGFTASVAGCTAVPVSGTVCDRSASVTVRVPVCAAQLRWAQNSH
jgi:hypothetical protein